jgi:hypothetical protein
MVFPAQSAGPPLLSSSMYVETLRTINSACLDSIVFPGPGYDGLYYRTSAASSCRGNLLGTPWTAEFRDFSRALCV